VLLNYWLAPDMLPFIRQIQISRMANTVAFVESIQPNDIDGEGRAP